MSDNSKIEWTDATWNPVLGCDRVSPGCDNCYAIRNARIRESNPNPKVAAAYTDLVEWHADGVDWTGQINLLANRLDQPFRWRSPRRIFVNSQSDLFHSDVPDGFVGDVWNTMALAEQHTFQILTKRPVRARALLARWAEAGWTWRRTDTMWCGPVKGPLEHVQIGVSVEDQRWADLRIPALLKTPAAVRFLSCEPLLGPLDLLGDAERPGPAVVRTGYQIRTDYGTGVEYDVDDQVGIDWVIVGGESGPGARPMDVGWVRDLRDQCSDAGVPLFVKQLGTVWARENHAASRKGADPAEWPEDLRVQQMPTTRVPAAVS